MVELGHAKYLRFLLSASIYLWWSLSLVQSREGCCFLELIHFLDTSHRGSNDEGTGYSGSPKWTIFMSSDYLTGRLEFLLIQYRFDILLLGEVWYTVVRGGLIYCCLERFDILLFGEVWYTVVWRGLMYCCEGRADIHIYRARSCFWDGMKCTILEFDFDDVLCYVEKSPFANSFFPSLVELFLDFLSNFIVLLHLCTK